MLGIAHKNTSVFLNLYRDTNLLFSSHHDFPLELHFALCRHTAHVKLTLQCYLTGGTNKGSVLGFFRTGAASHVAALILHKAHGAYTHSRMQAKS